MSTIAIPEIQNPANGTNSLIAAAVTVYDNNGRPIQFAHGGYDANHLRFEVSDPNPRNPSLTPDSVYDLMATVVGGGAYNGEYRYDTNDNAPDMYYFTDAILLAEPQSESASQSSSDLEPTLNNVPWNSSFALGAGVDAVTGNLFSVSALNPFQTEPTLSKESTERLDSILSYSSMRQLAETATSGQYNIQGVKVTESTRYLTEVRQSACQITYIAEYRVQENDYQGPPQSGYSLTSKAQELMRESPRNFRSTYGDYFIASMRNGASFRAVYTLKAQSASDLSKFETSAGVSVAELFSKEGSAKFENEAQSFNLEVEIFVHMIGIGNVANQPTVLTPADVPVALDWFKKNLAMTPLFAKLIHYNSLYSAYPRTVPVSPDVFVELRLLYTRLWDIRISYNSLPAYYRGLSSDQFNTLNDTITANQSSLPQDTRLRASLQHKADVLARDLQQIRSRQNFYEKVREAISTEPAQGAEQKETTTSNHWSYGMLSSPDPENFSVLSVSYRAHEGASGCGYRGALLQFGQGGKPFDTKDQLVVGWEVVANWTDGTDGHWQKASPTNLLTNYAAVSVKSKFDRGMDWSVNYYYVNAAVLAHFDKD
jgi:hypothetical protein